MVKCRGSVYFVVKTMLEDPTERKSRKAEKTASNYALTKRHQEAERTPYWLNYWLNCWNMAVNQQKMN